MIQLLYTIYDEKAEVFLPPFFTPTKGIAERAFIDCVQSDDHQFSKHPADYTLFYLGQYHDHDASFDLVDKKVIGNGVEFLNVQNDTFKDIHHGPPDSPVLTD